MPIVPTSGGPRAQLGVTPDARLSLPDMATPDVRMSAQTMGAPQVDAPRLQVKTLRPELRDPSAIRRVELSDRGARQMIQAGQNLAGASDALGQAAMAMQLKVNATIVDDAMNDARELARRLTWGDKDPNGGLVGGYRNAKGYDAIKRESGKSLDDEVAEEFDAGIKELAKSKITNADQRMAFERQVNDIAAQLRQGASIHQAEQFDSYYSGVYKGMVSNLTADFGMRDPTDLAGQKEAMGQIEGAVAMLASHQGASAQELEVGQRAARGAAVASLFDTVMAEKKYDVAQALLNEWGEKIDANTAVKMKLSLDGRVSVQLGEQLAESAWRTNAAPAFEGGDPQRAFNIMLGLETRTRHVGENGRVMRSPKGAFGIAQLMPDTAEEVAKGLGRPELAELAKKPTKKGEAANRLLGETYFNQLLTKFKGDVPKAMAAYNAGPGRVQDAIRKASAEGGDWTQYVPKETQDYVSNGMRSFGAGEGRSRKPTRQELLDAIDSRTTDPDVRRAAYSWLDRRFSAAEADERDRNETAFAQALTIVRETGGNINAIPPELKARVKPDQFDSVQTYAKNIADGAYQATKPEAYYTAMIAASDPRTTVNQLEAMRPDLSEQDFAVVRKQFLETRAPQPGQGPDSLDVSTLDKIVDTRLEYLGIDPSPEAKDKDAIARIGAIRQFTHQYVLDMQRQTGKKFTDFKALQDVVNQMFTRSQGWRQATIFGERSGRMNVMTATVKDILPDTRQRVTAELEKHLGRKPSDAEILQAYFRSQFYGGTNGGR